MAQQDRTEFERRDPVDEDAIGRSDDDEFDEADEADEDLDDDEESEEDV